MSDSNPTDDPNIDPAPAGLPAGSVSISAPTATLSAKRADQPE